MDGQDNEIYLWNGERILKVTENTSSDTNPVISDDGSAITWMYKQPGKGENDLEIYKASLVCEPPA